MNKLLQNKFYRFEIMTNKTTYFLCQINFFGWFKIKNLMNHVQILIFFVSNVLFLKQFVKKNCIMSLLFYFVTNYLYLDEAYWEIF